MITFAPRVGVSPGTTTMLALGRTNTSQDPGVIVRNADGHLRGLGAARGPSDFDLAKVYGYLPVHRGWISGRPALSGSALGQSEGLISRMQEQVNRFAAGRIPSAFYFEPIGVTGKVDKATADAVLLVQDYNLDRLEKQAKEEGKYNDKFQSAMWNIRTSREFEIVQIGRIGYVSAEVGAIHDGFRQLADHLGLGPPLGGKSYSGRGISTGAKVAVAGLVAVAGFWAWKQR